MTLYDFKLLTFSLQAHTTWEHGIYLGFREEGEEHLVLYRIDNFFIEIIYNRRKSEITAIKSFVSDGPLEPYLERIDLSEFIK
jgi:hypothetical protein